MRILSMVYILISISSSVLAQNSDKKKTTSEGTISFQGVDAWGSHKFNVNIYFSNHSGKLVIAFQDSVRISSLRNDLKYISLRVEEGKFGLDEVKPRWISDSLGKVIENHYAYTKDSVSLDLAKHKNYENLLKRFCSVDKHEIVPKIEGNWLDGYILSISIATADKRSTLYADTPKSNTHPLLIEMLSSTLDRFRDSAAGNKIRSYYIW
jgi:hypothetical protein